MEPLSFAVVLDTGCQRSAVGSNTLERIRQQLPQGLTIKMEKQSFSFRGVGGVSTTTQVAVIPVSFGGRPGIIRAAVLTGSTAEAPLLISLPILKALGTEFSLKHSHVKYTELNTVGFSLYNPRGQLCLDLFDFDALTRLESAKWKPKRMLGDECTIFLTSDAQVHSELSSTTTTSSATHIHDACM